MEKTEPSRTALIASSCLPLNALNPETNLHASVNRKRNNFEDSYLLNNEKFLGLKEKDVQ
jgi:hypothetical protein